MNNEQIIQEATEAVEKNLNAGYCVEELLRIIKEQKSEIAKKDTEIDILIRKKKTLRDEIAEQRAEIERLTTMHSEMCIGMKRLKSEAYREFNARLYAYKTNIFIKGEELMIIPMSDYDEILKELTESNE